jgi:hypothetical protein
MNDNDDKLLTEIGDTLLAADEAGMDGWYSVEHSDRVDRALLAVRQLRDRLQIGRR